MVAGHFSLGPLSPSHLVLSPPFLSLSAHSCLSPSGLCSLTLSIPKCPFLVSNLFAWG